MSRSNEQSIPQNAKANQISLQHSSRCRKNQWSYQVIIENFKNESPKLTDGIRYLLFYCHYSVNVMINMCNVLRIHNEIHQVEQYVLNFSSFDIINMNLILKGKHALLISKYHYYQKAVNIIKKEICLIIFFQT